MVRKIIIVGISIIIFIGGIMISNTLENSKKPPVKKKGAQIATVFAEKVQNDTIPIQLRATGTLNAKNRIELYAEVQGIMTSPMGSFKEGSSYRKNAPLVRIESDVFEASLMAQKSSLQNLVTGALADIRLDYPSAFDRWNQFVSQFDLEKALPKLPEPATDKEKMFITGRNIYSTYYNVKNLELTLAKYNINAPFDGVLTEALVSPGTLIRPGQKLGTFIQPSIYELIAPVSSSMVQFLKVGQQVELRATDNTSRSWMGEVSRINSLINSATQTVNVYVQVSGKGLEEGMYMETDIHATELYDAYELDRSVLFDQNQVYIVQDTVLVQKTIEPLYFNDKTAVIRGLMDGEKVLSKLPPSAYPGMKVTIYKGR